MSTIPSKDPPFPIIQETIITLNSKLKKQTTNLSPILKIQGAINPN
jgi:hypothetical protein